MYLIFFIVKTAQKLKFFAQLGTKQVERLCATMKIRHATPQTAIFLQGAYGFSFFIILQGLFNVLSLLSSYIIKLGCPEIALQFFIMIVFRFLCY